MKKIERKNWEQMIQNPILKKIVQGIIISNLAFLLVFISEFIVRADAKDVLRWMEYFNLEFILTFVLVLSVLLTAIFLCNHLAYGYLLTGILVTTISIVNYYKLDIKGEQLSVQDFALMSELATMAGDLEIHISKHLIWSVLFLVLIFLILLEINFVRLKYRRRVASLMLCGVLAFGVYENIYAKQRIVKNSFLLTLVTSASASNIEEPSNYTKQNVKKLLQPVEVGEAPTIKPNVIIIMDESFFNLNTVEGLKLSKNPLAHFETYQEAFTSGNIIGPKIGGYTAQTEYEVLTGNSTDFTGVSNVAYIRYIKPGMESLVSVFKNAGYTARAIHPYDRKFYSRDKVYREFGFDYFIAEDQFENSPRLNEYITDGAAFSKVIEEYEANKGKPFFAHVVTMQNHTPYTKNENPSIKVENTQLSEGTKDIVESYASGLSETDKGIDNLLTYFKNQEEPTVVMIFGDHIPILGESAYDELNYLEFNAPEDYKNGASTPFLIWNNYGLKATKYNYIDSSYLGAVLLKEIGFSTSKYFNYLGQQLPKLSAYHSEFFINQDGVFKDKDELGEKEEKVLENLWILQYDRIFGKNYGEKE